MQVIFFPYAGGSGQAFRALTDLLPMDWKVQTLELPGRGQRIREPLCENVDEIVEDLMGQLDNFGPNVGFFGHSMGAVMAYLVAQALYKSNKSLPDFMICSGFRALHLPRGKTIRHCLSSADFREELRKMGGVPDQIMQDEELMDFFEPIIRSDFKISEEFVLEDPEPLPVPLYTFFGTEEDLTEKEKEEWEMLCTMPVERHDFRGEHFFIFSNKQAVADRLEGIARNHKQSTFGYL